jgi:hypothetical protein
MELEKEIKKGSQVDPIKYFDDKIAAYVQQATECQDIDIDYYLSIAIAANYATKKACNLSPTAVFINDVLYQHNGDLPDILIRDKLFFPPFLDKKDYRLHSWIRYVDRKPLYIEEFIDAMTELKELEKTSLQKKLKIYKNIIRDFARHFVIYRGD